MKARKHDCTTYSAHYDAKGRLVCCVCGQVLPKPKAPPKRPKVSEDGTQTITLRGSFRFRRGNEDWKVRYKATFNVEVDSYSA